jgi:putative chitobiose transport system substrate-binding protein
LYQAGEIALLASGPQFFQTIAQNAPDIAQVSEAAPQITGKTGKKTVAVMNLVIPKNSDRPEDAIEFALFLTNAENQLEFAKQAKVLPSAKAALADPYFQTIAEQGTQVEKALAIGAQQLEDAEVLLPMRDDINELQRIIYDNLQAAMLEEKTVEAAIADAEQQWNNR